MHSESNFSHVSALGKEHGVYDRLLIYYRATRRPLRLKVQTHVKKDSIITLSCIKAAAHNFCGFGEITGRNTALITIIRRIHVCRN